MLHQCQVQRLADFVRQGGGARNRDGRSACCVVRRAGGLGQVVDDVQQVLFGTLIGSTLTFDQPAAQRQLMAQLPVGLCACNHGVQPPVDHRLLMRKSAAAHAQPFQAGQHPQ